MPANSDAVTPEVLASFLEALKEGDKRACANTTSRLLKQDIPLEVLYEDLFRPAMYAVGELWERNEVSVAVEHRASSIVEHLLQLVYPRLFSHEPRDRTAVVCCSANEYHQIGGKMVADLLELRGWDTHFLGADTPTSDLLDLLDREQPQLLAVSLSVYFNLPGLLNLLDEVRSNGWDHPVIVGGQAFRHGGREAVERFKNVKYVASISDLNGPGGLECDA